MDKVAVILVLYNNQKYIQQCVDSLLNQTYSNTEIIAVNNASPDDSSDYIKNNYPNVKVIDLYENVGFAGGCNEGIKYALDNDADYCLLLNVDTVADKDMVYELVSCSQGKYVVSPYIYYSYDKLYKSFDGQECATWYAGGRIDKYTAEAIQDVYEGIFYNSYEVEFISGCCMLVPAEYFRSVGLFSTEYFMYYEDADYCYKLNKNNVVMKYCPATKLWHAETGSEESHTMKNHDYYCMRNMLYFVEKNQEFFSCKLIDVLKRCYQQLTAYDIELNDIRVKAQLEGIKDFLGGKVGKKVWKE